MNLIDLRHELCILAQKFRWQALVDEFGALYAETGRPELPIRLMVGLNYLKHAHELSFPPQRVQVLISMPKRASYR